MRRVSVVYLYIIRLVSFEGGLMGMQTQLTKTKTESLTRRSLLRFAACFGLSSWIAGSLAKTDRGFASESGSLISNLLKGSNNTASEFTGIPNSRIPTPPQRYIIVGDENDTSKDDYRLLTWYDGNSFTLCSPAIRVSSGGFTVSPSEQIAYKYTFDSSGHLALEIIENGSSRFVAQNILFFNAATRNDSYLTYFIERDDSLDMVLYSIKDHAQIATFPHTEDWILTAFGSRLFYITNNTLCMYNTETAATSIIDTDVARILLATDDGSVLYHKPSDYEQDLNDYLPQFYNAFYYDGTSGTEISLNTQPFASFEEYFAFKEKMDALSLNEQGNKYYCNAYGTQMLFSTGDILDDNAHTYVYALGEKTPRELEGGWGGNWNNADSYETFLDPQLTVYDSYSESVFESFIQDLIDGGTPRTIPFLSEDNHWFFSLESGNVYRHEMGSRLPDDALYLGGDAVEVILAGASGNPYVLLESKSLIHIENSSKQTIAAGVERAFWVPSLQKLAFISSNSDLFLTDPLTDTTQRIAKNAYNAHVASEILFFIDYAVDDIYPLYAVDAQGVPVCICEDFSS